MGTSDTDAQHPLRSQLELLYQAVAGVGAAVGTLLSDHSLGSLVKASLLGLASVPQSGNEVPGNLTETLVAAALAFQARLRSPCD